MRLIFRRATVWTALNLTGMALYLWLASNLWILPGEAGLPGGPGDAFYWFFFLLPILFAFLALNSIALAFIVKRVRRTGALASLYIWLAVASLWLVTVKYDHLRSYRVIDAKYSIVYPSSPVQNERILT